MKKSLFGSFVVLVLALVMVLGLAGCGKASGDGAKPVGTTTGTPDAKPAETAAGTKANPLPIGTGATIGDWEVTVTKVNSDAWSIIKKANQFNKPATKGSQYVLVSVSAKYVGEDSGTFWTDVRAKFLGSEGNTFDDGGVSIDNEISSTGETFPGASVKGDMVFTVPTAQFDGGAIIVEQMLSMDDARTFWAVK